MPIRRDSRGRFSSTGGGTGKRVSAFREDARALARKENAAFAASKEGIRRQQASKEIRAAAKARPAYKGPRTAADVRNSSNWRVRRDRSNAGLPSQPVSPAKIKQNQSLKIGKRAGDAYNRSVGAKNGTPEANKVGVKAMVAYNRKKRIATAASKAGLGRRKRS
jgi:hypothetical protein